MVHIIDPVLPSGMPGRSEYDTELDTLLRDIAQAASTDPNEWAEKYGTNFENDVFMMHRYCWCEEEDCPWCEGCTCPPEAFHYFIDGREVSMDEWMRYYDERMGEPPEDMTDAGLRKWLEKADEVNSHRDFRHDPVCDYCLGTGIYAEHGAEPGKGAPHFWFKPTNFKVWWYKYIGRGVETNRPVTKEELERIRRECLESLKRGDQHA